MLTAILALTLAATVTMTIWAFARTRATIGRERDRAYVESVRYGMAQRRHEWYGGYKQGLKEGRRG